MTTLRRWLVIIGSLLIRWGSPTPSAAPFTPMSEKDVQFLRKMFITPPREGRVAEAVREAFTRCGLPAEQFSDDFNLTRTGKLHELLHHTGDLLGDGNQLQTIGDVRRLFNGQ